jgi:hypothetical protein
MDLRKAVLEKLHNDEKDLAKFRNDGWLMSLQPEVDKAINPVMKRYMSVWVSVAIKIGLLTDARGNPVDLYTNNGTARDNHSNRGAR